MGASGWEYRVPYTESLQRTLEVTQQELLAGGEYIWPWEGYDPDYLDEEPLARPSSREQLAAAKTREVFWEEGTHTLLDVDRVCDPSAENEFAAIRPLTAEEMQVAFGTQQPTSADFDRVYEPQQQGILGDLIGGKWSGRGMVIHTDTGAAAEVFLWGWSGD